MGMAHDLANKFLLSTRKVLLQKKSEYMICQEAKLIIHNDDYYFYIKFKPIKNPFVKYLIASRQKR